MCCVREAKCRLRADVDHINSPSQQRSGTRLLHQSNLVIAGDITLERNLVAVQRKVDFLFYPYLCKSVTNH